MKTQRRLEKQAREIYAQGGDFEDIADELDTDSGTAERWVTGNWRKGQKP